MLTLYPPIRPNHTQHINVSNKHHLYVEESGNPHGLPVMMIHGGPGRGNLEDFRRFFDPSSYRIILFDQRGCGHSTPHGELSDNNTTALIEDIETIRESLQIDRVILVGEGFGATLCLLYGAKYTQYVRGIIVQGVYLNRPQDLSWLYEQGAKRLFPDYWQEFSEHVAQHEHSTILNAYHKRLHGNDEVARMSAAKAWVTWIARCSSLNPQPHLLEQYLSPHVTLPYARIASHYYTHQCFLAEHALEDALAKLNTIPGIILHGRYDMITPVDNAWFLHQHWPSSHLHIIRDAGHAITEPSTVDALIHATLDMAERYPAA